MSSEFYSDTIYGQVVPYESDLDDKYQLAIVVDGEEEFIVEPDSNGRNLSEYVDQWIKAQVYVNETDDGFFVKIREVSLDEDGWKYDDDSW
ncbi:hypothetical protein [Desulfovibrio gilichinskyi]|uniref:Uncharacterized protein n=1 Tax=Desulfovibrio gilichinskyi TaxID=1519643 RepID=A0A1X7E9M6_9BACT|nr:hypothetical protein [Desulfovibrio gilichinskyi]SMF30124.1 hypothetical protein SAMN06295933_2813 [Desulfovibrio gilichinskyi]